MSALGEPLGASSDILIADQRPASWFIDLRGSSYCLDTNTTKLSLAIILLTSMRHKVLIRLHSLRAAIESLDHQRRRLENYYSHISSHGGVYEAPSLSSFSLNALQLALTHARPG